MLSPGLSIVVPTYGRDDVLLETLRRLFAMNPPASEIIVVDQTDRHSTQVSRTLNMWQASGRMRWLRLRDPSIPGAMNRGLLEASNPIVLFLDDDVIPESGRLRHTPAHWRRLARRSWLGELFNHGKLVGISRTTRASTLRQFGRRGSKISWAEIFRYGAI